MNAKYMFLTLVPVVLLACAGRVDVGPMLDDFDRYDQDLEALARNGSAGKALETGRKNRAEAAMLIEDGKAKAALPIAERALADAQFALEAERMDAASRRAEACRLEVAQAQAQLRDAMFVLEQTEQFIGKKADLAREVPEPRSRTATFPKSLVEPGWFPPLVMHAVVPGWTEWREAAEKRGVAAADLVNRFEPSYRATEKDGVDEFVARHHAYLGARIAQSLECRVRAVASERVCADAAEHLRVIGDARAEALGATLELERGMQDDLRRELDDLRAEARSRQDELFDALQQMEGKFASIHRDARGTIVSLADILFDFDKATLRRDVEFNLVKISTILNQFGEMGILIEGHTDNIGTDAYNLDLSKRRAKAVHDFLVSQGVDEARLSWDGYGESRPVADNSTEEGRQANRRVDLVIQDAP